MVDDDRVYNIYDGADRFLGRATGKWAALGARPLGGKIRDAVTGRLADLDSPAWGAR